MDQHALESLEFLRIRDLLVERAASVRGRERAAALRPIEDLEGVRETLATVGEAWALVFSEPTWPRLAVTDLRPALARAAVAGALLEPPELLAIARLLSVAREAQRFFATPAALAARPRLARFAAQLFVERAFEERVERTFEPSGEMSDRASPELHRLRRELLRHRQQASGHLEELSRRLGAGEEPVVTLRGGRYVLGVAAAEKRRVKGIVHDRSATGKTVFLEPLEIIEVNNALAELEADERQEIRRILLELTSWVGERTALLQETLEALGALDEFDARARLARDLRGSLPVIDERSTLLRIVQGRHPLLHLALGERVVPLDLTLEGDRRGVIVSGPNMGGKTVVLKTVGLLSLMALAGLYVPAREGTVIPWVGDVLVDIGDEQSLDSDLSTYGARLRNMEAMLARANDRTLVLVDELGAGTDPEEGTALGQALLAELGRRRALCVVTTHHGSFKSFAAETPGFENAAVEYDPESLRPTFRLRIGLPGRSHAFELARREGWPEAILGEARRLLSRGTGETDELLARVDAHRIELERAHQKLKEQEAALEQERGEFRRLSQGFRERMEDVRIAKAVEEDRRLRSIQELLQALRANLEELERGAAREDLDQTRRTIHAREREAAELAKNQRPIPRRSAAKPRAPLPAMEIAPGRRAYSRSLGVDVKILEGESGADRVWVVHRGMRIALATRDLLSLGAEEPESAGPGGSGTAVARGGSRVSAAPRDIREEVQAQIHAEIDLRGLSAQECRERLDLYLDRAILAGYPRVRIIHGKGEGILRRTVQQMLKEHRLVRDYRDGEGAEGGWGVTIALLGEPGTGAADTPAAGSGSGEG
ncbi:MAG: Smr/MutS family protein [Candidatus Eisenbacteria bacterium]